MAYDDPKEEAKRLERQQKAAAEQREKGRFGVAVEDTALAVAEDPAFIGAAPEYREAAYDTEAPVLAPEDTDVGKVERNASEVEQARAEEAKKVGFRGYAANPVHPSKARQPAQDYIEQNRAILAGQVAQAEQAQAQAAQQAVEGGGEGEGGDDGSGGDTPPAGGDTPPAPAKP